MKNMFKKTLLLALGAFIVYSCTERDNVIDEVLDGVINGAVLRTLNTPEDNAPITIGAGNEYVIEVEEQDEQDGDLLQEVRMYVRFNDNTILSAGSITGAGADLSFPSDGSDVLLQTFAASDFTDGPFGLPRRTITITEADLASVLPIGDFNSNDTVTVRLELELTDGRIYSVASVTGIIEGGFFASPFQYGINIDAGVGISYLDENRNSFVVLDGFDNTYGVTAELTDQEDGNNIETLNVYRRFVDNTPDNGDNTFGEELMATFTGGDFGTSEDGFPTADVSLSEAELLGALTDMDVSVGDAFYVRYEILTVDGRTVTNEVVETDFYDEILVTDCPFPPLDETQVDTFIGDYLAEQLTPTIFGYDTWDPDGGGVVLTLFSQVLDISQFSAGTEIEDNQRSFDADYLAPLGGLTFRSYVIEFGICTVNMVEDAGPIGNFTGWACGGVSIITGPLEEPAGSYNAQDDSVFVLQFFDDFTDACSSDAEPQIRFTKQD